MICIVVGLFLNSIAVSFFSRRRFYFSKLFTAVALEDICICVQSLFISISLLSQRSDVVFTNEVFCQVSGILWRLSCIMSVHLVSIISILRAVRITSPLTTSLCNPLLLIGIDFVCLMIILAFPQIYGQKYSYVAEAGCCMPLFAVNEAGIVTVRSLLCSYLPAITFFLPLPIIVVTFILCFYHLIVKTKALKRKIRSHHVESIFTVVTYMAAYLFFNLPLAALVLFVLARVRLFGSQDLDTMANWGFWYLVGAIYLLGVIFNALANPLIYLWRINDFRSYFRSLFPLSFRQIFSYVSSLSYSGYSQLLPLNRENREQCPVTIIDRSRNFQRQFTTETHADYLNQYNSSRKKRCDIQKDFSLTIEVNRTINFRTGEGKRATVRSHALFKCEPILMECESAL